MVCPRCISTVEEILKNVGIDYNHIELGRVEVKSDLDSEQSAQLSQYLSEVGFELILSEEAKMVNLVKSIIIERIHYQSDEEKLSVILSHTLKKEYSIISKTFRRMEGITIEQYQLAQRMEKVKELLQYDEKTVSEIAYELGFSNVGHLSNQFKKMTGLSPSEYKNQNHSQRRSLDAI